MGKRAGRVFGAWELVGVAAVVREHGLQRRRVQVIRDELGCTIAQAKGLIEDAVAANDRRSLASRIRAAANLSRALYEIALEGNGRATERTVDAQDLLRVAKEALVSVDNTARYVVSHSVANSYGYRVDWSIAYALASEDRSTVYVEAWRQHGKGSSRRKALDARDVRDVSYDLALHEEIAVRGAKNIWYRVAQDGRVVGVTIPMPEDLRVRGYGRWEYGVDIAACETEIARKRAIVAMEARQARLSRRDARAIRLLARYSMVTADLGAARAMGYCLPGVEAWARARGYEMTDRVACCVLARDSDERARALALRIARAVWEMRGVKEVAA